MKLRQLRGSNSTVMALLSLNLDGFRENLVPQGVSMKFWVWHSWERWQAPALQAGTFGRCRLALGGGADVEWPVELGALWLIAASTSEMIAAGAVQAAPRAPPFGATAWATLIVTSSAKSPWATSVSSLHLLMPKSPLWERRRAHRRKSLRSPFTLRHEWFAALYKHSRADFDKSVVSAAGRRVLEPRRRQQRAGGQSSSQTGPESRDPFSDFTKMASSLAQPKAGPSTSSHSAP